MPDSVHDACIRHPTQFALELLTSGLTIHLEVDGTVICGSSATLGDITRDHLFCGACLDEWKRIA